MKIPIILAEWSGFNLKAERCFSFSWLYNKKGIFCLLENLEQFSSNQIEVILIINNGMPVEYDYLKTNFSIVKQIIYRNSNLGLDFGAYAEGYKYLISTGYLGDFILMNSSCIGPGSSDWLNKYKAKFLEPNMGLVGATYCGYSLKELKQPFKPHVQSYFLYTSTSILTHVFPAGLNSLNATNKDEVIIQGEIWFSTQVLNMGYKLGAIIDDFTYGKNDNWLMPSVKYDQKYLRATPPFTL
ncbi:MAG: rhamnan synthesis F family protein [Candidatus Margulisiibacteriota bacterium]|nr:rhamnan synthesis F family protein [Candidatus Margulisiibacteriota bacterium]